MNGRVYDPLTAMFFSPDPFVQATGDWKNYNRYSYCMNNPTRYTDPSGYKYYNKESVWFAEFAGNWMNQATSGSSSTLKYWSDHQGSISYNPENKRYEYRSGAEATIDEAMSFLFRGTNHTVLTVTGQEAINAYKRSYLYINGRGHDEAVRNRVLANIEKSANDMIAKIEKGTVNEWNNLVGKTSFLNSIKDIQNTDAGDEIIFGQSVDVTLTLVSLGWTGEGGFFTDGNKNTKQFISNGWTLGLEASAGYNFIMIFPKKNFKFNDLEGTGASIAYNIGIISISFLGNTASGYPENSVFETYWGIKIGIGAGIGGSCTPNSNTTFFDWIPDITKSQLHWR